MLPVQITTRDMSISPTLETHIRKRAEKLHRYFDRISSCRIVIEIPQKHKHQGKLYNVRIDVTVPGKEFVANRNSSEDIYIAIRDAFKAIERQLEEHSSIRHGQTKTHNNVHHGHVVRIVPSEGFGFIEGTDGNEYYFSITNVSHPSFAQLMIGDSVEYSTEANDDGWQAQHVVKEKNHHYA